MKLSPMTSNIFDMVEAAIRAAKAGWKGDPAGGVYSYTKAGVILGDLLAEAEAPQLLLPPDRPRDARLMYALDTTNSRFGKKTLALGREGFGESWVTKADLWSPRYTTRIGELPVVRV